jgi:hypothetical protein
MVDGAARQVGLARLGRADFTNRGDE